MSLFNSLSLDPLKLFFYVICSKFALCSSELLRIAFGSCCRVDAKFSRFSTDPGLDKIVENVPFIVVSATTFTGSVDSL
jgi:hypothetical protein